MTTPSLQDRIESIKALTVSGEKLRRGKMAPASRCSWSEPSLEAGDMSAIISSLSHLERKPVGPRISVRGEMVN